jgi:predicted transposase YbfD/YdcC
LLNSLKATVETGSYVDTHTLEEKHNGIKTTWKCCCYDYKEKVKGWKSIKSVIVIYKTVVEAQKETQYSRFYVSSSIAGGSFSAQSFNLGIKGHWGVENKVHKNKDVIFKQDNNRVKAPKHAVNRAIFNTIALNFLINQYKETVAHSQILFRSRFEEVCLKNRT